MMIDQRAIIDPSAKIADDVSIGPWTIIGKNVVIGEGTRIASHVIIDENTIMGKHNEVYSHTSLGSPPQYVNDKGEQARLEIGDHNMIREFVSINRATALENGVTKVGDHNHFMAYTHVAHDCVVGNHVTFVNLSSIAGHVVVEDYVTLGAYTGVHQFCRLGAYSFLGRASKIYQDILPYVMIVGNPGVPAGLNAVGLRRHGFSRDTIKAIKIAYRLINRRGLKLQEIKVELAKMVEDTPEIIPMVNMINTAKRGFSRAEAVVT